MVSTWRFSTMPCWSLPKRTPSPRVRSARGRVSATSAFETAAHLRRSRLTRTSLRSPASLRQVPTAPLNRSLRPRHFSGGGWEGREGSGMRRVTRKKPKPSERGVVQESVGRSLGRRVVAQLRNSRKQGRPGFASAARLGLRQTADKRGGIRSGNRGLACAGRGRGEATHTRTEKETKKEKGKKKKKKIVRVEREGRGPRSPGAQG